MPLLTPYLVCPERVKRIVCQRYFCLSPIVHDRTLINFSGNKSGPSLTFCRICLVEELGFSNSYVLVEGSFTADVSIADPMPTFSYPCIGLSALRLPETVARSC